MSDEQINIAIAEACGWLKYTQFTTYPASWGKNPARYHTPIWGLTRAVDMTQDECTKYGWQGDGHISINNIPDYCNDLNAMHEAEITGLGLKYSQWTRELQLVCGNNRSCVESATAKQRAEAFLRTVGKWEE